MFSWDTLKTLVTWGLIVFGAGVSWMSLKGDVDTLKTEMAAVAAERNEAEERRRDWYQWKGTVNSKLDQIIKKLDEK